MKKSILLLILGCLSFWGMAQNTQLLDATTQTVRAQINLAKGVLTSANTANGLNLSLKYGELMIQYQLPELGEEGRFYEVKPSIKLNGRNLPLVLHEEFRGEWNRPIPPGNRQMTWINLIDRYTQLEGELEVSLTIERWGEPTLLYDCSLGEPGFTPKQRRPYYLMAGLGIASIGAGQLFRNQSQDVYDNDYADAENLDQAQPLYDDANGKHHTYLIMTYAGAAILAVDATLYLIRQRKYKKNLDLYNKYCKETTTSLRPVIELPSVGQPSGGLGLKMSLTF